MGLSLAMNTAEDTEQRQLLVDIRSACDDALSIVSEFLDFDKVSSGLLQVC